MTDKELLEMAAKAGEIIKPDMIDSDGSFIYYDQNDRECGSWTKWNPLADDCDALRLAVKLMLKIDIRKTMITVEPYMFNEHSKSTLEFFDDNEQSRSLSTRRAIVRAAAEIGRNMP